MKSKEQILKRIAKLEKDRKPIQLEINNAIIRRDNKLLIQLEWSLKILGAELYQLKWVLKSTTVGERKSKK